MTIRTIILGTAGLALWLCAPAIAQPQSTQPTTSAPAAQAPATATGESGAMSNTSGMAVRHHGKRPVASRAAVSTSAEDQETQQLNEQQLSSPGTVAGDSNGMSGGASASGMSNSSGMSGGANGSAAASGTAGMSGQDQTQPQSQTPSASTPQQ